jgi:glycerophosphoryl diester phosphodiesterase
MSILQFQPPVIAHRGASAYAPENTFTAFTKAAQMGIKWLEFDVMSSASGDLVVFHDETVERTSNGHGKVSDLPYLVLAKLDAGSWFDPFFAGQVIPAFPHVLDFLHTFNMSANIEIKASLGNEEKTVKRLLQDLSNSEPFPSGRILFSSFSVKVLQCLRKHAPESLIGLLQHEWNPDWQHIIDTLACVSVHAHETILTSDIVQQIKDRGLFVLSYTINDPRKAKQLYSWGVDALFSDLPDKILDVL